MIRTGKPASQDAESGQPSADSHGALDVAAPPFASVLHAVERLMVMCSTIELSLSELRTIVTHSLPTRPPLAAVSVLRQLQGLQQLTVLGMADARAVEVRTFTCLFKFLFSFMKG
jgi:hypothetical protein